MINLSRADQVKLINGLKNICDINRIALKVNFDEDLLEDVISKTLFQNNQMKSQKVIGS